MYYLIEILKFNDGTKDSYSIYNYDTRKDAISKYHKEIGGWLSKDNIASILCIIINDFGEIIESSHNIGNVSQNL